MAFFHSEKETKNINNRVRNIQKRRKRKKPMAQDFTFGGFALQPLGINQYTCPSIRDMSERCIRREKDPRYDRGKWRARTDIQLRFYRNSFIATDSRGLTIFGAPRRSVGFSDEE